MKLQISAIIIACSTSIGFAQVGGYVSELTPTSGDNGNFGATIVIAGSTVAIGAPEDATAYLFDISNIQLPTEIIQYSPAGAAQFHFGQSIAILDNKIAFGVSGGTDGGALYPTVYIHNLLTGQIIHTQIDPDLVFWSEFGFSLSANSTEFAIGHLFAHQGENNTGSAYTMDGTSYSLSSPFIATGQVLNDEDGLGFSIDTNSSYIAIGSPLRFSPNTSYVGAVQIHSANNTFLHEIQPADGQEFDEFGYSVSVSDSSTNLVLIGAPHTTTSGTFSGAAYLYDMSNEQQLHKFTSPNNIDNEQFGASVCISGNYAIVGAPSTGSGSNDGHVYVFDISDNYSHVVTYAKPPSAGASLDRFGYAVDGSGPIIVIGAPNGRPRFISGNGEAFIYNLQCNIADVAYPYGVLNFFDVSAFLSAHGNSESLADLNHDGIWDFFDVSAFLTANAAGCP